KEACPGIIAATLTEGDGPLHGLACKGEALLRSGNRWQCSQRPRCNRSFQKMSSADHLVFSPDGADHVGSGTRPMGASQIQTAMRECSSRWNYIFIYRNSNRGTESRQATLISRRKRCLTG